MRVHLIQMILEDRFRVGHLEDRVGDAVLPFSAAVKQVRFHPSRVFGIFGEEVGKVRMIANSVLDQVPIPISKTKVFIMNICINNSDCILKSWQVQLQFAKQR